MKIAYVFDLVYPYNVGGVQKRIWEIALRLAQRGHDVTLFGMKYWDGDDIIYKEGVRLWGVCPVQKLFVDGHRSIKEAVYFAFKVLSPLCKEKYDIVDCQEFPHFPCFSAKLACILYKQPLVITWYEFWGNYWYEYIGRVKGSIGRLVELIVTKLPDKIIPISNMINSDLRRAGVPEKRLKTVFNGVDVEGIRNATVTHEESDIIFAGRLVEHKNVDMLIKAIDLLRQRIPSVKCVIIGDGPEKNRLENLATELNVKENVSFLGFLAEDKDVIGYIKSSKIFVLPSKREGLPNTILEANSCGIPVIIVNENNNAGVDVVTNGKNGFIVEPTAEAIEEKLYHLLSDKRILEQMKAGIANTVEQYNWPLIVRTLENTYMEILNEHRK
jgi:L-malate glycosyltransferase